MRRLINRWFSVPAHVTALYMPADLDKLQTAAMLDDVNTDWALLQFVAEDFQLRRVLLAQTVDVPLVDAIPWDALLTERAK